MGVASWEVLTGRPPWTAQTRGPRAQVSHHGVRNAASAAQLVQRWELPQGRILSGGVDDGGR